MTLRETYNRAVARLRPLYGDAEARAVVERLFDERYGIDRLKRVTDGDTPFVETESWESDLRRLEAWEPVQYVIGSESFYGRRFALSRETLIPRSETEMMVRKILRGEPRQRILDIGTGSGAIAVTLAAEWPTAQVEAWDISTAALETAAENAQRHGVGQRVRCVERDVLHYCPAPHTTPFDLVVSNPPYVLDSERAAMRDNVTRYEPPRALYVPDSDPLRFYRAIAQLPIVAHGGELWFEINERFGQAVAELLHASGYDKVRIRPDLHGRDRFVTGRNANSSNNTL